MKKGIYIALAIFFGLAVIGLFVEDEPSIEASEKANSEIDLVVHSAEPASSGELAEDPRRNSKQLAEKAAYYQAWITEVEALHASLEPAKEAWWSSNPDDNEAAGDWGEFARDFRTKSQQLRDRWQQPDDVELVFMGFSSEPAILVGLLLNSAAFRNVDEYEERTRQYNDSLKAAKEFITSHIDQPEDGLQASTEWYEGGTLHQASALDWQVADYENKLATAADFVSGAYSNEMFNDEIMRSINNMADMRYIAEELVVQLDNAMAIDDDPEMNRQMYANQEVNAVAVMVMIIAGWVGQ